MTLVGDAQSIKAGSTNIVALYAGATKVWPVGQPPPDGTAHWEDPFELKLVVEGIDGYTPGTYRIQVAPAPATIKHPTWVLGQGGAMSPPRMFWGSASSVAVSITGGVPLTFTAQQAADTWAGHLVAFTISNTRAVTNVEVVA
jgi:hypothetical protein